MSVLKALQSNVISLLNHVILGFTENMKQQYNTLVPNTTQ